jgi:hypothetical protein
MCRSPRPAHQRSERRQVWPYTVRADSVTTTTIASTIRPRSVAVRPANRSAIRSAVRVAAGVRVGEVVPPVVAAPAATAFALGSTSRASRRSWAVKAGFCPFDQISNVVQAGRSHGLRA